MPCGYCYLSKPRTSRRYGPAREPSGGAARRLIVSMRALLARALPLLFLAPLCLQAERFIIDYRKNPRVADVQFDFAIVGAEAEVRPDQHKPKLFYAYISAGEISRSAPYFADAILAGVGFIGENGRWD